MTVALVPGTSQSPPQSTTAPVQPAGPGPQPPGRIPSSRVRRWFAKTPNRFRAIRSGLVVLSLLFGLAGLASVQQRSARITETGRVSGPLSIHAQDIYRSLSDADATAANAFLTSGAEPPALRQRYLDDIAQASASLSAALRAVEGDGAVKLAVLTGQLPVYTGLVETARSYNRIGLPLGAAYLREASGLMRQTLLPTAQELFQLETERLERGQHAAAGLPWWVLLFGGATVAGLILAQVDLSRRTRRLLNPPLVAATVATLALFAWSGLALTAVATHADRGRTDASSQLRLLAQARVAALQARADEALTLVARGSGAESEVHYQKMIDQLVGADRKSGVLGAANARSRNAGERAVITTATGRVLRWLAVHEEVRRLDNGGQYLEAVALATSTEADRPLTLFGLVDSALAAGIASATDRLDDRISRAGGALRGATPAIAVLTVLTLAGTVVGMRRRIGEYR